MIPFVRPPDVSAIDINEYCKGNWPLFLELAVEFLRSAHEGVDRPLEEQARVTAHRLKCGAELLCMENIALAAYNLEIASIKYGNEAPDALELLQQQSVLIEHIVSTRQALERLATKALAGDDAERREVFAALEAAGGRVDRLRLSGEEPQRAPVCWADEDHQPTQQHQQQHVPPPWLIGRRMSREHHRGGGSSLPNLRRSSFGEFHTGVGVRSSVRSSFGDSHNGTVATRNSAPRQSCSAVSPMRAPTSEKSSFSSADGRSFAVHPRPSSSASMSDARASSPSSGGPLLPRRIAIVAPSEVVGRTVRGRLTAGSSAHLADCVVPDVAVYESLEAAADDPAPVVVICYSGAETVFDAAAARSLPRFYWTAATADGPEHEQEQEQDQFLQLRQHERGYVVVGDVSPETQDVIHMELYGFCDLVDTPLVTTQLLRRVSAVFAHVSTR